MYETMCGVQEYKDAQVTDQYQKSGNKKNKQRLLMDAVNISATAALNYLDNFLIFSHRNALNNFFLRPQ